VEGLAFGVAIDSLIEKLMTAEKNALIKVKQQKQTHEWHRDAYRGANVS